MTKKVTKRRKVKPTSNDGPAVIEPVNWEKQFDEGTETPSLSGTAVYYLPSAFDHSRKVSKD